MPGRLPVPAAIHPARAGVGAQVSRRGLGLTQGVGVARLFYQSDGLLLAAAAQTPRGHINPSTADPHPTPQTPRGYINLSTAYIGWLMLAVFYHLPSLEALGFDVRADVSLALSVACYSVAVRF